MEDNEKDDLFEKARQESIKNLIKREEVIVSEEKKDEIKTAVSERLEEGETQWDLLKKMIDGSLTEKFIRIMLEMNDRDFVRSYLKLLEYAKPKMTRIEGGNGETNDLTVNIQTLVVNENGEKVYVPINELEDGAQE